MNSDERLWIFKSLVGSVNYNLNTETSDKDYKVFVVPSFNDLYFSRVYSESISTDEVDLEIHDIRKLDKMLYKSNVNFLEILFSKEVIINKDLVLSSRKYVDELFKLKESIAKMNLPYLYDACIGVYRSKMMTLEKGTRNTAFLVEKYGYDTKSAMSAYRILDFIKRYKENDFKSFKKAIEYTDEEREFLIDIKNGVYSLDNIKDIISDMLNDVESNYKKVYKSYKIQEETYLEVMRLIKKIVKLNVKHFFN